MRIFLANPPTADQTRFTREGRCQQSEGVWTTVWPPLSLAQSAAVLREAGFDVRVADAPTQRWSLSQFLDQLKIADPQLVVLATSTPSFPQDVQTIETIRRTLPNTVIAAIGIHVSVLTEDSFANAPGLDVIIRGEPEYSLRDLAESMKANGKTAPSCGSIPQPSPVSCWNRNCSAMSPGPLPVEAKAEKKANSSLHTTAPFSWMK